MSRSSLTMSFLSSCVSSSANHCMRHQGFRPSDAILLSLDWARRILKVSEKMKEAHGHWLLKYRRSGPHYRLKATLECHSALHWCAVIIAVHSARVHLARCQRSWLQSSRSGLRHISLYRDVPIMLQVLNLVTSVVGQYGFPICGWGDGVNCRA